MGRIIFALATIAIATVAMAENIWVPVGKVGIVEVRVLFVKSEVSYSRIALSYEKNGYKIGMIDTLETSMLVIYLDTLNVKMDRNPNPKYDRSITGGTENIEIGGISKSGKWHTYVEFKKQRDSFLQLTRTEMKELQKLLKKACSTIRKGLDE